MRQAKTFIGILLTALVLAVWATTPPTARGADAPASTFAAGRAMADVRVVAQRPHPTGSPDSAAVRAYLVQRMIALGMEVSTDQALTSREATARRNKWSGRQDPPQMLMNLIGILPGRDRTKPAVMLMSHHDTVWGSPGAADDTAGVASSLEVVRALRYDGQPKRDLIVLMTDGEELGLEGAKHFFAAHPLRAHVGAVINMEARGGGGRTSLFQTSRQNGEAIALYADAVHRPAASSLSAFVYSVLPNDTDLTPVIAGPYTAYNLAFIGRPALYHSPAATPDRLDQGALQDMGGQVLDLTRALLAAPAMPAKTSDVVFFDLFGLTTIAYAAWLGWLMLAGTLGCLVFAQRGRTWRGPGGGAIRFCALLIGSAAMLYLLNWLSRGLGASNYYDRLAAISKLEVVAALAGLGSAVLAFGNWHEDKRGWVGSAAVLLFIGALAQWFAPTAAYVVVLPLFLVAAAALLPGRFATAIVAALVVGYMLSLGHQLMQGVGPSMPMAAALPLGIAVLALLPLWPVYSRRYAGRLASVLFIGAGMMALWVQLDPQADTVAVYSDNKG